MTRIIENIKAHYETHEVPFGRGYDWYPEHIIVECDCGERFTLTATAPGAPVGVAQTLEPSCTISKSTKLGCRTKASTLGSTTPKSKRSSIGKTRLLMLRIRPGATTTLRRAWEMIKRDGRRPEHSHFGPLFMPVEFPRIVFVGSPASGENPSRHLGE